MQLNLIIGFKFLSLHISSSRGKDITLIATSSLSRSNQEIILTCQHVGRHVTPSFGICKLILPNALRELCKRNTARVTKVRAISQPRSKTGE